MSDTQASITLNAYDRTQAAFRSAMASMEKFRKSAFNLKTALVGVLSGVAIGAGIKSILDYGDKTAKLAETLKITTKELQQYRFAGEQSRLTNEEMDKGLTRLSKSLGELRIGQGSLYTFLKTADPAFLNTLKNSNSFSEALNLVIQRIGALKSPTEQAALANAAFGRSFQGFIRLSAGGGKVLADLKQQALDLGIVLSDKFLKNAEKAGDEWNIVTKVLRAAWANIVDGMLPSLSNLSSYLGNNSEALRSFGTAVGKALEGIGTFAVKVGQAVDSVSDFYDKIKVGTFNSLESAKLSNENLAISINKLNVLIGQQLQYVKGADNAWTGWGKSIEQHRFDVVSEKIRNLSNQIQIFKVAIEQSGAAMTASGLFQKADGEGSAKKYADALNKKDDGAKEKEQLQKKLNDMEMSFLSAEEKQYVHLSKMRDIAREGYEKGLIDKEEYLRRIEDMEERTAEKVAEINQKAADKQYRIQIQTENKVRQMKYQTANLAVSLLQTLGQKSKAAAVAAILLGKGVAIAQVIQNTAVAIMKYASMGYAGLPMIPVMKALGAAQIALIAGTGLAEISNLNKGGAGGGIGAGASSPGESVANSQKQETPVSAGKKVMINLGDGDDLISKSAVRKLIEKINQEVKDGATLITT